MKKLLFYGIIFCCLVAPLQAVKKESRLFEQFKMHLPDRAVVKIGGMKKIKNVSIVDVECVTTLLQENNKFEPKTKPFHCCVVSPYSVAKFISKVMEDKDALLKQENGKNVLKYFFIAVHENEKSFPEPDKSLYKGSVVAYKICKKIKEHLDEYGFDDVPKVSTLLRKIKMQNIK